MAYGYSPGRLEYERNFTTSPANVANQRAEQIAIAQGNPRPTSTDIGNVRAGLTNTVAAAMRAGTSTQPRQPAPIRVGTGSSGGGVRRSGGGGGGAPAPKLGQSQLDWLTQLLAGARPGQQVATNLDLPDYAGMPVRAFDPSMYQQALAALGQGQQTDLGTASQATSDMLNFLNTNYSNAFNNPNLQYATAGQAPGTTQLGMQRLLQDQGVNPNVAAGNYREAQSADQAFGNLWRSQAANEDIAQRSRLGNAQQYGNQAVNAINAAAAGGRLGINLGQAGAQSQWQQRADDRAYQDYQLQQQLAQQEALQNWQRANQVSDTNFTNQNQYSNSELQALLGLLPQFIQNPGLNLPTPQALGLAA
jgi:hypothetical protein